MSARSYGREKKKGRLRWFLIVALLVGFAWAAYSTFYAGPVPAIALSSERPAIGAPTTLSVSISEPKRGLGKSRLYLIQGENKLEIARDDGGHPPAWKLWEKGPTETQLSAIVGRGSPKWLEEGEATLRVVAERLTGPLRSIAPAVLEKKIPVRLRPPSISISSGPLYIRQGGSGLVVFRPGPTTIRSGVIAGDAEFVSYALPGSNTGERVVLFGVPWNVDAIDKIRLFAEDDAGNRAEKQAPDGLRRSPPRQDTIRLSDRFLERVVPAIVSQTPKLDGAGDLVDVYLRINGPLRQENRAFLSELSRSSAEEMIWHGPFLQLRNSARRANFAETRSYVYNGRRVDRQTHLGLDLASVARAPVPAPNAGVVLFADYLGIYGNVVVLDHGLGMTSVNAHLSAIEVAAGERVERGQTIGRTGATGLAGGDHLHLGIFLQGTAVDPIEWLDGKWIANNVSSKLSPPATEPDSSGSH